ncbi:MAG: hypothetical protein ABFD65_14065 [Candidatus Polarisedimenticolia bacterium]
MKHTTNGIDPGDRKERVDRTYAPDAKKARAIVRDEATHSLAVLAEKIALATGEQAVKHRLQERAEAFRAALKEYAREELKAADFDIGWMGPKSGIMPAMPTWAPEHKAALARAWNELLFAVNEATKVGVQKLNRYRPIELQVDLDDSAGIIVPGGVTWN